METRIYAKNDINRKLNIRIFCFSFNFVFFFLFRSLMVFITYHLKRLKNNFKLQMEIPGIIRQVFISCFFFLNTDK